MAKNDNPFGDNAGTRVGRPATPQRDNEHDNQADGTTTGAGQEAARSTQRTDNKSNNGRPGSEPIHDRSTPAKSGYGGEGGAPRKSADQKSDKK